MIRTLQIAMLLAVTSLVAGCIGGTVPVEEYLRLELSQCGQCDHSTDYDPDMPVLGIKEFSSLPSLDRTAVAFAKGKVLTHNTEWYWEGIPAELVAQALSSCLDCATGYRAIWPYTPRIDHAAQLVGRVDAFEVRLDGTDQFVVEFHLGLWSYRGKTLLSSKSFKAAKELGGRSASNVAAAADEAMFDAVSQARQWLDSKTALMTKQ